METTDHIQLEPDHAQRIKEDTPWQFRRSDDPVAQAFWHAVAHAVQMAEEHAFDVVVSTGIADATGDALDQWGSRVGEKREGLVDDQYRRIIDGRIRARASRGRIEELRELTMAIAESDDVQVIKSPPAGIIIQYTVPESLGAQLHRRIAPIIGDAIVAGVGYHIIEALPKYFGFEGDEDAEGFGVGVFATTIG